MQSSKAGLLFLLIPAPCFGASPLRAPPLPDVGRERAVTGPVRRTGPAAEARQALPSSASVRVAAVVVEGMPQLGGDKFASAISPFIGQDLDEVRLRRLADAVASQARELGYPFVAVRIAPQPVEAGILKVTLYDTRIDAVRVRPDLPGVAAALEPLTAGRPLSTGRLERQLLLAGDVPGVELRDVRYRTEAGRNLLDVTAVSDPLAGALAIGNDGSVATGRWRASAEVTFNRPFTRADQLTLFALGTPTQPNRLFFGYGRYGLQVLPSGLELAVSGAYSRSRPAGLLRVVDSRSEAWQLGAEVSYPLARSRKASVWTTVTAEVQDSELVQLDFLTRADRSFIVSAGLSGFVQTTAGRVRGGVSVSQGIDALGATPAEDLRASRAGVAPDFTTIALWAETVLDVAPRVSLALRAESQWSAGPLLIGQKLSLGGRRSGRGYDYGERSGDRGALGSAELRWTAYRSNALSIEPYIYGDGGRLIDRDRFESNAGDLASAGGGARVRFAGMELAAELAVPLTGPRFESGSKRPRVNLGLTRRF